MGRFRDLRATTTGTPGGAAQPVPGKRDGDENQLVELADGRILMDYPATEGGASLARHQRRRGPDLVRAAPGETVSAVDVRDRAVHAEADRR